ncbi:2-trimethylaminoethylphosphonate dioxygenase [Zavarzinia sp. CC-PAN008]|uniref:2-trimethylaminoethylphosphonate dioxygenase n=1 Tax=Zavarzinia sp. CC-PAN008 TaxID=3243332 RepID=UPI003F7427F3
MTSALEIQDDGRVLALHGPDGDARFHALWLRDSALDPATRSAGNGQRLITVLDLDPDVHLTAADSAGQQVHLAFSDGHRTVFDRAWLLANRYDVAPPPAAGWVAPDLVLWDATAQDQVARITFAQAGQKGAALRDWLAAIRSRGFGVMSGVPALSGSVAEVASLFAHVRETNYGRWFDVRAEVNPTNLAYTNLGLQAHTDNPYRDPVPTLQLLHCLENSVAGGHSVVIDGFAVARRLQQDDPDAFALLSGHCMRFRYAGASDVQLDARRPMLELAPDGELIAVRFNNRSAAPVRDVPFERMPAFYAAYRRFSQLVEDPAFAVTFRLEPGELFIVDNTRVLHGRTSFTGDGRRWLQGCYADKDGLLSTLAVLEQDHAEAA